MDLRSAAMADAVLMPLATAAGRIAAAPAGLYPPGIPLVCPGEIISNEVIGMLRRAGDQQRFGVEGECLLCVNG